MLAVTAANVVQSVELNVIALETVFSRVSSPDVRHQMLLTCSWTAAPHTSKPAANFKTGSSLHAQGLTCPELCCKAATSGLQLTLVACGQGEGQEENINKNTGGDIFSDARTISCLSCRRVVVYLGTLKACEFLMTIMIRNACEELTPSDHGCLCLSNTLHSHADAPC